MRLAAAAGLALALVACAQTAPIEAPAPAGGNWLLPGTDWRLVALDGAPFEGRATATLTSDGRVVGEGPCNAFVAPYSGRWPDLTFAPAATTRRACPDLALEAEFLATLARVDRASIDANGLSLVGPDGASLLFERAS